LLLTVTTFCVFIRFVRWQFLLRRTGVRIPIRPGFSIFLASLVGIATPAYVGETIRTAFVRAKFGVPIRMTLPVLVLERISDVAALAVIAFVTAEEGWTRAMMALLVAAAWLVATMGSRLAQSAGVPAAVLKPLGMPNVQFQTLSISLIAWLPAALLVWVAAGSLKLEVAPATGMHIFSTATLFGGVTLMPAGVGATGSLAIVQLQRLGHTLTDAVVVVSLVRLTTIAATLVVATVFLVLEWKTLRRPTAIERASHFNDIAGEYRRQFSTQMWNHLLERKTRLLRDTLPNPSAASGLGLDLGCGLGLQCLAMRERGYRVVGLDQSHNLLRHASNNGVPVVTGSALALPFRDESLVRLCGGSHAPPSNAVGAGGSWPRGDPSTEARGAILGS
jgi:hypothetical protein